jgi:dipeptidyl aminopeptidase/acylaminoacyl peptidase
MAATSGYIVLAVNPRGSSSYGLDFGKAVLADWGGEDYLDIMQAVDELAARPYVDEDRMGLHGYSYGGFMSSWIVGQTTRFKAAVVGAPCIDLPSFSGTADIGISFGEVQWGGIRHEAYEKYLKHSPLTYAPNVETPVLLLHGEADHRCPIEQSEQYFVALKRMGKTVEFVRFPGCSHLFLRFAHPKLREEYLIRMKAWLDRYLLEGASTPEPEAVGAK